MERSIGLDGSVNLVIDTVCIAQVEICLERGLGFPEIVFLVFQAYITSYVVKGCFQPLFYVIIRRITAL